MGENEFLESLSPMGKFFLIIPGERVLEWSSLLSIAGDAENESCFGFVFTGGVIKVFFAIVDSGLKVLSHLAGLSFWAKDSNVILFSGSNSNIWTKISYIYFP